MFEQKVGLLFQLQDYKDKKGEKKATPYQHFKQGRVKGLRHCYVILNSTKTYNLLFPSRLNINVPNDSLLESVKKKHTQVYLCIKEYLNPHPQVKNNFFDYMHQLRTKVFYKLPQSLLFGQTKASICSSLSLLLVASILNHFESCYLLYLSISNVCYLALPQRQKHAKAQHQRLTDHYKLFMLVQEETAASELKYKEQRVYKSQIPKASMKHQLKLTYSEFVSMC